MPTAVKKSSREELFARLSKLETELELRKFVSRHKELVGSEVVKELADLVVERVRVDTKEALRLGEAALLIARRLRSKEDLALGLWAKANGLYASGDNHAAVEHHEQALEI
jgi:hypothetical protein